MSTRISFHDVVKVECETRDLGEGLRYVTDLIVYDEKGERSCLSFYHDARELPLVSVENPA